MGEIFNALLNLDEVLKDLITTYGVWVHAFIFATLFLETGLVIFPFLPGDSLLFAAGLFSHPGQGLNLWVLLFGLPFASVLGDSVNFHVGKFLGGAMIRKGWIKVHWVAKTRKFYEVHGAKTIIIGRFVPFVRTFAPFVAGAEVMEFRKYLPLCIIGSCLWVWLCVGAGYLLGGIPWVRHNFEYIILGVVAISIVAIIKEVIKDRKVARQARQAIASQQEPAE